MPTNVICNEVCFFRRRGPVPRGVVWLVGKGLVKKVCNG